jgi:hypothetical protein
MFSSMQYGNHAITLFSLESHVLFFYSEEARHFVFCSYYAYFCNPK